MTSMIYDAALTKIAQGAIQFGTDTIKVMLVTSAYTPVKNTHAFRSDVTNEVTGTGYTAGGAAATCSATNDTTNNRCDVTLGAASWASSTITARGAVYYKSRGGAATADEIIGYIDFGADIASTAGTFSLTQSILRYQN